MKSLFFAALGEIAFDVIEELFSDEEEKEEDVEEEDENALLWSVVRALVATFLRASCSVRRRMRSAESDDINENISLSLGDFLFVRAQKMWIEYTSLLLLLKLLHASNENTL